MSSVNLYDVLNVSNDCTIKEIKEAYKILVKEFHPDKPGGDSEMFELIIHAYNILSNPTFRKEYDELFALSKQVESSHFDLKVKAKKYYESQETDVTQKKSSKSKDDVKDFKKAFEEMDRKHGVLRDSDFVDKLDQKDMTRRLRDLELAREQDDIEHIHDKLFDDGRFNILRFNAAFDASHKKHDELIPHKGIPTAYNIDNKFDTGMFGSVENYENLYADDDGDIGSTLYGSVKMDRSKGRKVSKDDVNKLSTAEYSSPHNYKDKDYNKYLEQKIKEREFETKKIEERTLTDFDNDPSCGGYGILASAGLNNTSAINWDDADDIKARYKKLLEMRNNEHP
jgi:curved DNA-binding protein CbpA